MVDLSTIQTTLNNEQTLNQNSLEVPPRNRTDVDDQELSPKEKEEIANSQSTRKMKEEYAAKAYSFAVYTIIIWFCFVFIFLVSINKPVSDVVFGIITTACTVNILVAFHAVVKGLFSSKE